MYPYSLGKRSLRSHLCVLSVAAFSFASPLASAGEPSFRRKAEAKPKEILRREAEDYPQGQPSVGSYDEDPNFARAEQLQRDIEQLLDLNKAVHHTAAGLDNGLDVSIPPIGHSGPIKVRAPHAAQRREKQAGEGGAAVAAAAAAAHSSVQTAAHAAEGSSESAIEAVRTAQEEQLRLKAHIQQTLTAAEQVEKRLHDERHQEDQLRMKVKELADEAGAIMRNAEETYGPQLRDAIGAAKRDRARATNSTRQLAALVNIAKEANSKALEDRNESDAALAESTRLFAESKRFTEESEEGRKAAVKLKDLAKKDFAEASKDWQTAQSQRREEEREKADLANDPEASDERIGTLKQIVEEAERASEESKAAAVGLSHAATASEP